jgi:hypothetical protein
MKKPFLAVAASLVITFAASAGIYTDNNPANVWLNPFNPSYTGTFDIAAAGYNPASETVVSAKVEFLFFDVLFNESFSIQVGGENFASHGSFFLFLTIGDAVLGSALLDLDADGILSYTITRTSGEFWLKNAFLKATTATRPTEAVPDAGLTVAVLGLGLVGLGLVRQRIHPLV